MISELLYQNALFNRSFINGVIPSAWKKGVIHPIPKSFTADKRDPLSYREITVTSSFYKLYCLILNNRLIKLEEEYSVLNDAQYGFHSGRSTVDHISSLTSIIETRELKKQSTYVGFIDFKKAYDSIDRNIMFKKLTDQGLSGYIFKSILSLYNNVECCFNVNGFYTDWFSVNCGLKQGCCISTLFFNLYINDLITMVNALNEGKKIGSEKVAAMLYADDLVPMAENEHDHQLILHTVHKWYAQNKININQDKSNVVHFRPPSIHCSNFEFRCGQKILKTASNYTYPSLLLTEHLAHYLTAKNVAKAANGALGLISAKDKAFGGLPYKAFTKLFDTMVWSVISFGSGI